MNKLVILIWLLLMLLCSRAIIAGATWNPIAGTYTSEDALLANVCADERFKHKPLCRGQ